MGFNETLEHPSFRKMYSTQVVYNTTNITRKLSYKISDFLKFSIKTITVVWLGNCTGVSPRVQLSVKTIHEKQDFTEYIRNRSITSILLDNLPNIYVFPCIFYKLKKCNIYLFGPLKKILLLHSRQKAKHRKRKLQ